MSRHLLVSLVLVGVALGGGVHYDATFDGHWPYPTGDQIYTDDDRYVGEETLLFGSVESIDGDVATIEVEADRGTFSMTVRNVDADVEPGGLVQVYGVLEPDRGMRVSEVAVVERDPGERLFKYGTSVVGTVLALVAFFRYWRVDLTTATFEPR